MIRRYLSGFYNKNNVKKIKFIQDMVKNSIILKIIKIKKDNNIAKGTKEVKGIQEAKNIKRYSIKSFIFYYNNIY